MKNIAIEIKPVEQKIRCGQVYEIKNCGWYLLAQVGGSGVALIGLNGCANRYINPVKVANNNDITGDEFRQLTADSEATLVGTL